MNMFQNNYDFIIPSKNLDKTIKNVIFYQKMSKKIILRLSNGIGNQMFMYASAYSISKRLNRELFLDDETAFLSKKYK